MPRTECLKDTVERVLPFWTESIAPAIRAGKRVVVAAHGNSIRALVKYLDGISDQEIVGLNIPNGIPLVYELDTALKPIRHYYLGDAEAAARAAAGRGGAGQGGLKNPSPPRRRGPTSVHGVGHFLPECAFFSHAVRDRVGTPDPGTRQTVFSGVYRSREDLDPTP
jgi:hypothetical protein